MTGYVFCLEPHETGVGYQFIVANKSRLEKMDLEESSIDLAVATTPRIVVNEIVYDVSRQYFRKESDGTTSRILLLYPVVQENENGDKIINMKRRPIRYTGSDSYTERHKTDNNDEG